MNKNYQISIIVLILTSFLQSSEPFPQCSKNEELEKKFALLIAQSHRTEQKLEQLLEEIHKKQEAAVHHAQLTAKQEEANNQEIQRINNWFNNLPWHIRYGLIIQVNVGSWITKELWPTMKGILTQMIAQQLLSQGLTRMDNVTGSIPLVRFRFGESLIMNETQKAQAQAARLLKTDPELKQNQKELEQLGKDTLRYRLTQEQRKLRENLEQSKTLENLEKHSSYATALKEVQALEHEMAAFSQIHDLFKHKEELQRKKEDVLRYAPATTSHVDEIFTDDTTINAAWQRYQRNVTRTTSNI